MEHVHQISMLERAINYHSKNTRHSPIVPHTQDHLIRSFLAHPVCAVHRRAVSCDVSPCPCSPDNTTTAGQRLSNLLSSAEIAGRRVQISRHPGIKVWICVAHPRARTVTEAGCTTECTCRIRFIYCTARAPRIQGSKQRSTSQCTPCLVKEAGSTSRCNSNRQHRL